MNPAYLAEVERAFVGHAGRGLMLSPHDRARVADWARAGIPASVIVDGIARAFERTTARRVRSLGYAVPAIDESIRLWRQAGVGRAEPEQDTSGDLEAAFARLLGDIERAGRQASPADVEQVRGVWRAVSELRRRWRDGAETDPIKALFETERRLLDRAYAAFDAATRGVIDGEVADTMDGFSIHDPETRQITRQTLTHEAVRTRLGLPPLELRR